MKIRPTLQLGAYCSIFALGDIIDFPEGKRAIKGNAQISVVVKNLVSYLKDPEAEPSKKYTGSLEAIVLTNGKVCFNLISSVSCSQLNIPL